MMARLAILAVLFFAGKACYASQRIVGGSPTSVEYYPSLVQVDFYGSYSGGWNQHCAASILNSRFLLSSAQCFYGPNYSPENRRIRAGATYRNTGGVIAYVEQEYIHPSFRPLYTGPDGDIAVIRLSSYLPLSTNIQQTTILYQGTSIPYNTVVVQAGWGNTDENDYNASPVLQDTMTYIINRDVCRRQYTENLEDIYPITDNMICTGLLDIGGRGFCLGDDGGPLYYGNVLIGIMSFNEECGNHAIPDVHTNVASYTNWIIETAVL